MLSKQLWQAVAAFGTVIHCIDVSRTRDPDGFLCPTVTISSGPVVGTRVGLPSSLAIVDQFLGVPFAQSPPKRFEPPQPAEAWVKPLAAKTVKPACIQQFAYPKANHDINVQIFNTPAPEESEDCLYLNIFTPETPTAGPGRAVLFWLYPGGLQFGDASRPIYNGSVLAAFHDVVVVVPNFRSNVFGFSNSPELPLTSRNAGFWDQRLALQWVQDNIASFGGDPAKVTLFGNSAGGTSIDRLLTTSPVDPPFHAAILQSGQASFAPYQPADGLRSWTQLAARFGCADASSTVECLRDVPAAAIRQYIDEAGILFPPATDGVTQLSTPEAQRARALRNVSMVPVMIGSNGQEGSAFWRHAPDDLDGFLQVFFAGRPDLQRLVNHTYPLAPAGFGYETQYQRLSAIFTDLVFTCPTALWTASNVAIGLPTWRYLFNVSSPSLTPVPAEPDLGAYHTAEVPFVFGTLDAHKSTTAVDALSVFMQRAWTEFAKNPIAGPGWTRVHPGKGGASEAVADLAYMDETFSGVALVASDVVDSRCWVFKEIYESLGEPPFVVQMYH